MSSSEFTLRLARMRDAHSIRSLQQASFYKIGSEVYTHEQIEACIRHLDTLDTRLIKDQTYYVAEAGGELVGCGGWSFRDLAVRARPRRTNGTPSRLDPYSDAAVIRAVYTHPERLRCGIGRALVTRSEKAAIEAGFRIISLAATLCGAPLYGALGYRVTKCFNVILRDGLHLPAIEMQKELGATPFAIAQEARARWEPRERESVPMDGL
ncbi:MAG: GNAT family N-acetyltransferase [Alphaproteobacteria bacterium]|nr:GNAT family N-acetyltransferase [Alphaproteobacteria bacterium]